MPFVHEQGHRHLRQRRREPVEVGAEVGQRLDEGRRHHRVGEAQGHEHRLAERAKIEHARVRVERMEGRQRLARVAELAVVVVFHHPSVVSCRPIENGDAALEAQGDARRVLV
jgi:hypothetical protein